MKRPNPKNGFTTGDEQKLRREFEARIDGIVREAERHARNKLLKELGITDLGAVSTPGARWMVETGEGSPFPDLINKERGSLCLGSYTDFELANEVYLKADMSDEQKVRNLIAGNVTPIALLTAAKERIRWLSTHLDAALSREEKLIQQLAIFDTQFGKDHLAALVPMPFDEMVLVEDSDKADLVQKRIGHRGNHLDHVTADTAVTKEGQLSFLTPISSLPPESALSLVVSQEDQVKRKELEAKVEVLAEEIFNGWKGEEGWKPWEVGGNSNKQNTARAKAIEKLTDGVMKNAHVMTSSSCTDKGEPNAES